jgi:dipeptidyl-peptidase-4
MPALPVATGLLHPSRHLDNNRRVQPIHQPAKPSNFFRTIGRLLHFLAFTLAVVGSCGAAPPRTVRVLMWDEQQPEQKRAYGEKFLGETIATHLAAQPGFIVKGVSLASPLQGLDEATLNDTDVVIWWSHQKNHVVTDENVERLVTRVRQGRFGFIALHSAHWSRPFVRLMQERAKDDALLEIPVAERATAKFEYSNQNPLGRVPKRDAPLTPSLLQENGVWKLTLPGCIFPAYRADGAPSHVTTLLPDHPIAAGLPPKWDVKQTEMYDEPFHVPKPDSVVFEERWDKGEHFRSGCVWKVGQGRVVYFRPGHETYPVFKQAEPLRVVENAARWLAPDTGVKASDRAKTSPAVRFDPVLREIEGWKVHVEPALIDGAHRQEGANALTMLANHLQRIRILVPPEPLAKLRAIEIWIEHDHPRLKAMQYHPSRDWLMENGHDIRLARKVHITQAGELLSRSQMLKHPAVVLHELAHGYHDQFLSFDQPEILAAYHRARESGSYTNVLLYTGRKVKHYGLTDHKEYFAEGTEAYLYRNDFYPFVRAELKEHDPTLHEVLAKVWGAAD